MRLTINDIIKLQPCSDYTPERLEELAAGRTSVTPAEIAELNIPADDRLWVLTRLMTAEQRGHYSRRVASSVLHLWDAPDVVRWWLGTGDPDLRLGAGDAALVAAARARVAEAAAVWAWAWAWSARAAGATAARARAAWAAVAAAEARAAEAESDYDTSMTQYINWAAEEVNGNV